jgi:hypothetical protein
MGQNAWDMVLRAVPDLLALGSEGQRAWDEVQYLIYYLASWFLALISLYSLPNIKP